jgi:hypothetical protein
MQKNKLLLLLPVLMLSLSAKSQFALKVHAGAGYIEHFSSGITLGFSDKTNVLLLYGSNIFINTNDFVSYMIGYERLFPKWQMKGIKPKLGLKGGYAIYSDSYYRWKMVQLIPYIGAEYQLSKRFDIFADAGLAISHELSLERIDYGEIGNYRTYLPEFKIGINFKVF